MTLTAFKKAMSRGLGRCIIELDENEDIEKYRDIVLWGCLHNLSYDTQCEGTRSEYMYVLQSKFEDNYFESRIIEKFLKGTFSNSWLFDHFANMLYCFALDGSNAAYNALYSKYNKMYQRIIVSKQYAKLHEYYTQFEWLCIWIVSLDGIRAFKKIVPDIGYAYQIHPELCEYYTYDWFYAACKSNCGEKSITNYLVKESSHSENIKSFYDMICQDDNQPTNKERKLGVNDIIAASKKEWFECRSQIVRFSYKASDYELLELANYLVKEPNDDVKANLLWAFRKKGFPLDPSILIEYTKYQHEGLAQNSFELLSKIKNIIVRDYALELIATQTNTIDALSLLYRNFIPEDEGIILPMLKKIQVRYNDGNWHGMYIDAINWIENDKNAPYKIILYLFENTLCSSCREDIVRVMNKRKLLNDKLLKECLYDSNQDIRKYSKRKIKKNYQSNPTDNTGFF